MADTTLYLNKPDHYKNEHSKLTFYPCFKKTCKTVATIRTVSPRSYHVRLNSSRAFRSGINDLKHLMVLSAQVTATARIRGVTVHLSAEGWINLQTHICLSADETLILQDSTVSSFFITLIRKYSYLVSTLKHFLILGRKNLLGSSPLLSASKFVKYVKSIA